MSFRIGTYTTAHFEGVTGPHRQPLPLREREYGACAARCGCAMDWMALNEMAAERMGAGNQEIGAYRNLSTHSYGGSSPFGMYFGSYVDAMLGGSSALSYLDPEWTPQDVDGIGWDSFASGTGGDPVGRVQHAFRRASRPIVGNCISSRNDVHRGAEETGYTTPRTPRSLDEMRRLFYDMKRMFRIETGCTVTCQEPPPISYERYYNGGEYGNDPGTITLGSDVLRVPQRVRETQGYGVRNGGAAWAMVEMWCARDSPQIYRAGNPRRTLAVPCTLGGTLDTSRFAPQALKQWTKSVYGEFADGHDYYALARVAAVYADIDFPADYYLIGFTWQPPQEG